MAEAFESMLAGGFPYQDRSSSGEATDAIRRQIGQAFDPRVVDAFLALSTEETPLSRRGKGGL